MNDNNQQEIDGKNKIEFLERKRWVFFGLPWTFTKYKITREMLTIMSGFLNRVENDCYMYRIQDVKLTSTLFERIFGLGTVVCYTGDKTHPQLLLEHIRNAKEIKDYLLEASEKDRMRRRTLNTVDIGANDQTFFEE